MIYKYFINIYLYTLISMIGSEKVFINKTKIRNIGCIINYLAMYM